MTRKNHRDGERIRRVSIPNGGYISFREFLGKTSRDAGRGVTPPTTCSGCGTPEGCVHNYGCLVVSGRVTSFGDQRPTWP